MFGMIKERYAVYALTKELTFPVMVAIFDTEKAAYEFIRTHHTEFSGGKVVKFYEEVSPTWF